MANWSEQTSYGWRHALKDYTATAIFCTAIAITLWVLDLAEPLWASFVVSFSIGFSINTVSLVAHPLMIRWLPPMIAPVPTTLLRATLRRTRDGAATLGDELEILEALLAINQVRMGDRLRYSITAEPDLKAQPLPPMLVQPPC